MFAIYKMPLTSTHIAFLGIVSIFTGLIAPWVTTTGEKISSYLITDMRWIAYLLFVSWIMAFYLASIRMWRFFRLSVFFIGVLVFLLAVMTAMRRVTVSQTQIHATGYSWGWIFLCIGVILLFLSIIGPRLDESREKNLWEKLDMVIGIFWGGILACLAGIIILSSLSYFQSRSTTIILERLYESGSVMVLSWEIPAVGNSQIMPEIFYDRAREKMLLTFTSSWGTYWELREGNGGVHTGVLQSWLSPVWIGDTLYGQDHHGYAYSGGRLILWSRVIRDPDAIILKQNGFIKIIIDEWVHSFEHRALFGDMITLSQDGKELYWVIKNGTGVSLVQNGIPKNDIYDEILSLDVSENGENTLMIVRSGQKYSLIKNQTHKILLPQTVLPESTLSNGIHSLLISQEKWVKNVLYDGTTTDKDLQEIRERFLARDGSSYAYFGKPLWEEKWCLFTRYQGNMCGLEGYMNPTLGADGSSLLYLGKKDWVWSIYRNIDRIISLPDYNPKNIDRDYSFFDITNPRTSLIIEYMPEKNAYRYRKNGKILPWEWTDVSTKVFFGYDNHIITTAKDRYGWKILEL